MRDYLEELLDLLTQEDEEEAAEVWETQAASLILPKALEAEAPEGALELPEGMAAGVSRRGGAPGWSGNRRRNPLWTWKNRDCAGAGRRPGPGGGAFGFPKELDEALASGGERPVMGEMGRRRPAQFCWNRSGAGGGPFCSSRRRSWSGRRARRRPWLRTAGAAPWRRL